MIIPRPEYALEFLLAFDGRIHHLEEGYWIKFEIKRVKATKERPHGLSYSFTLHDPEGARLVGFDNAHGVSVWGSGSGIRHQRVITGIELKTIRDGHMSSRTLRR
jgi:hypothetical protein